MLLASGVLQLIRLHFDLFDFSAEAGRTTHLGDRFANGRTGCSEIDYSCSFDILSPVKLAVKVALIGSLVAKPIIIKSAIVRATADKLSYLSVGKLIVIDADVLVGAEAVRATVAAKKAGVLQ